MPEAFSVIWEISIHAPRTGSDIHVTRWDMSVLISIHAPRTGSDKQNAWRKGRKSYFNPRSPHGERRRSDRASKAA